MREIHTDSDIVYVVFHKMHIVDDGKLNLKLYLCELNIIAVTVNNMFQSVMCTV
jgi:hypothetical protein